jgi:hypothetical protein
MTPHSKAPPAQQQQGKFPERPQRPQRIVVTLLRRLRGLGGLMSELLFHGRKRDKREDKCAIMKVLGSKNRAGNWLI